MPLISGRMDFFFYLMDLLVASIILSCVVMHLHYLYSTMAMLVDIYAGSRCALLLFYPGRRLTIAIWSLGGSYYYEHVN
ncbi:hypothetical protein BRADI_4g10107v3 [Brachypodium distachyon]|uniref:Uncharacterized protein n=1 Tax=Brachypodium distachyon TaxID=15368 RepID=A0A2K2CLS5_BRADI|nr:hypothetical protein BRADI_4g10107v3 [Brachypodium distachyon]